MHNSFWSVRAVHLLALETQRLAGQAGHVVNFRVVVFRYMVARFRFLSTFACGCRQCRGSGSSLLKHKRQVLENAHQLFHSRVQLASPARSCPGPSCSSGSAVGEACQEIAVPVVLSKISSTDERKKRDRTSTHVNILLED